MEPLLLLFSAGKESLLSLHRLHKKYAVQLLFFDYGQKAFTKEYESLAYYAALYGCFFTVVEIEIKVPDSIKKGTGDNNHVFFRNGIFLSHAVNIAKERGINKIGFGYTRDVNPVTDSMASFVCSFEATVQVVYPEMRIISPISRTSHNENYKVLLQSGADVSHLWSCDKAGHKFCGVCYKCSVFLSGEKTPAYWKWLQLFFDEKYHKK